MEVGMKYTKEIIKAMRTASYLIEPPTSEVIGGLLDEIERLQSENRWIPVSERLPEDDDNYLIAFSDKSIYRARWNGGRWEEIEDGEYYGHEFQESPTHWRPLPQPPEED